MNQIKKIYPRNVAEHCFSTDLIISLLICFCNIVNFLNNSLIFFPGWVEHGVKKISIKDSDYFEGCGRYAITSFFGNKERE